MTDNEWGHGKRFYTPAEALALIRPEFDSFRDYVRSMARGSFDHDELRDALVLVIDHFDHLDDAVLARFGQPRARGVAQVESAEWPVVNGPQGYPPVESYPPQHSVDRNLP